MPCLAEACGVVAAYWTGTANQERDASPVVLDGLLSLQHRGQLSSGITSYHPGRPSILHTHKALGKVDEVFQLGRPQRAAHPLRNLGGPAAIGHNRYATAGEETAELAQPVERPHGRIWKWFAYGFNGNLVNYDQLLDGLKRHDYHPTNTSDSEIIKHYISRELRGENRPAFKQMFRNLARDFEGAYSLVYLDGSGTMVIARDKHGFKPLVYGMRQDGLFLAASESVTLTNMGIHDHQSLPPGCLIEIDAHTSTPRVQRYALPQQKAHCFFEWIYFASLASVLEGRSVYEVRRRAGELLARQELDEHGANWEADPRRCVVVSVPETADVMADAFAYALGLPVMDGLIRNRYVGRSFIDGNRQEQSLRMKFTPLREVLAGKTVYLIDDTLVRGNTLRRVLRDIREFGGARSVQVRIGCPPIVSPCFYGIDMPTKAELFAPSYLQPPAPLSPAELARMAPPSPAELARMAADLGAESLRYLNQQGLMQALGIDKNNFCTACISGKYPTPEGQQRARSA